MSARPESSLSKNSQLHEIGKAVAAYCYLPFASDSVPGAYVEAVVAEVRGGAVLRTYDFVDVIKSEGRIGWQVKSTKATTPVTWKRAKIPRAQELIAASRDPEEIARKEGLQALGNAVIEFCNRHAAESLEKYGIDEIGFSRVLVTPTEIIYYEKILLTTDEPRIFDASEFTWEWSTQKKGVKKEQLSALHGRRNGEKWWAWHGLGENQLHFAGERYWWPPDDDRHRISLPLPAPDDRLDFSTFGELVTSAIGVDPK